MTSSGYQENIKAPRILSESRRQQMPRLHVQQSPAWCRKGMGKEYNVSVPKRAAVTIAVLMGSTNVGGRHNTRGRWLSRSACQKSSHRWNCVGGRGIVRNAEKEVSDSEKYRVYYSGYC